MTELSKNDHTAIHYMYFFHLLLHGNSGIKRTAHSVLVDLTHHAGVCIET